MRVYKFGGASVKDASGVRNLKEIVAQASDDLMVVISAMGKTTNALERVVAALAKGDDQTAETEWLGILDQHVYIMQDLGLQPNVDVRLPMMPEYNKEWSYDQNYDQIVSLGEIMSTQIVAVFLLKSAIPTEWWNMPKLLLTDNTWREAQVDLQTSAQVIRAGWNRAQRPHVVVTQGFIGGTADGMRTTLGREGSDYTAALLGNFLDAESVTIWKDVPGILNADPRLVANTIKIDQLTYHDAVELAYSGAQVIHPKTIRPLENKKIPLYVKPFGNPTAEGSVIIEHAAPINVPVYIWRTNQVLITLRAKDFAFVLEESLSHIFQIIHANRLRVSLIQSSAVTISVCVDNSRFVARAIEQLQDAYRVTWNENLSLLTIRGTTPNILKQEQQGRDILLSQLTRRTAKLVIKD
ncbi:MAG: aspartate kinase [Paludibacteraceae bacterium]|nr:aspartate kinase [Paludibacteraceae bacterium]